MYENPIMQVTNDIQSKIIKDQQDTIMQTITQTMGFEVDKEELIKALNYDRNQYTKGHNDGYLEGITDMKNLIYEIKDELFKLRKINLDKGNFDIEKGMEIAEDIITEKLKEVQ